MSRTLTNSELYDETARDAALVVISRYSTSFNLATRLLGVRVRDHVRVIYALVRLADEIVDGPGRELCENPDELFALVDQLENETLAAVELGFSSNLIVHAFAQTARESGIGPSLISPFFDSMRADVQEKSHDKKSYQKYVYGSAEVVGLMCLQVFVNADRHGTRTAPAHLIAGARRLGSAFQEINFLRDAEHDRLVLGRDYLDHDSAESLEDVLTRVRKDLNAAARVIPQLPRDCRRAVTAAHQLFAKLISRLDGPGRASVPKRRKAVIAARAWAGFRPGGQL